MHIVLAVVAILGAAAVWWYRIKYMSEAAGEIADAVGRVQGGLRRGRLRKKAALSPITAIDDPATAAATVITAIAAEGVAVSDALERRVREEIRIIAASDKQLDEAVIYAKWATDQVADVPTVIDKTTQLLKSRLNDDEKQELVAMLMRATPPGERHAMFRRRVDQLQRKLGLEVDR
jgi:DNA-binding transcriptional regulator of glucitol operon